MSKLKIACQKMCVTSAQVSLLKESRLFRELWKMTSQNINVHCTEHVSAICCSTHFFVLLKLRKIQSIQYQNNKLTDLNVSNHSWPWPSSDITTNSVAILEYANCQHNNYLNAFFIPYFSLKNIPVSLNDDHVIPNNWKLVRTISFSSDLQKYQMPTSNQ